MKVSILSLVKPKLVGKQMNVLHEGEYKNFTIKDVVFVQGPYGGLNKLLFKEDENFFRLFETDKEFDLIEKS